MITMSLPVLCDSFTSTVRRVLFRQTPGQSSSLKTKHMKVVFYTMLHNTSFFTNALGKFLFGGFTIERKRDTTVSDRWRNQVRELEV